MKLFASFKTISSGIDKNESLVIALVSDIYKRKFNHIVKVSEVRKDSDKKNGVTTLKVADVSVVLVDGVITEVQPKASKEAREIIKALKSQSKIKHNF